MLDESDGHRFRAALLIGFMADHMGHNVVMINEHSPLDDVFDPEFGDGGYSADHDFWRDDNSEAEK